MRVCVYVCVLTRNEQRKEKKGQPLNTQKESFYFYTSLYQKSKNFCVCNRGFVAKQKPFFRRSL